MRSTSRSATIFFSASTSFLGPTRRTVGSPWAVIPSSSQTATPIVFVPTSRPITRIEVGTIPSRGADAIHQPPENEGWLRAQVLEMPPETLGIADANPVATHTAPVGRENTMSSVGAAASNGMNPAAYEIKEGVETAAFT